MATTFFLNILYTGWAVITIGFAFYLYYHYLKADNRESKKRWWVAR